MKQPVERRLAAILAADVAGYSRLMGSDEEGTLEREVNSLPAHPAPALYSTAPRIGRSSRRR